MASTDVELRLSAEELERALPESEEVFRLTSAARQDEVVRRAGVPVELRKTVELAVERVLASRGDEYEWDRGWDSDGTTVHIWIRTNDASA
jgi:hypothetical protein